MSRDRAVSSVLGVVMILAITLAAVTSLMVIGGVALQDAQHEADLSRMETSMAQMSSKASLAALGDANTQRFDLGNTGASDVSIRPDAGNVTILYNKTGDGSSELIDMYEETSLGAVVFSSGDAEVAYQGGGVWKRHADDGGTMVSPPEYHYRHETLTYPIIRVVGDTTANKGASGVIQHRDSETIFPNSSHDQDWVNPVDDLNVYVRIESDYHRGWYEFFDSRSEGEIEYDPENKTVLKELSAPFDESLRDSVTTVGDITGTDRIEGSFAEGQNRLSASPVIEDKIAEYDEGRWFGDTPHEGPVYYADDDAELGNVEFDSDNTSVIVNGTLTITDDISMQNEDAQVEIFVRDGIKFDGSGNMRINADGSPEQLLIYVHSDANEIDEGNQNFNGEMSAVIYAPGSHLEWSGSLDFSGAIVTKSADFGGAIQISSPEGLEEIDLNIDTEGDFLRYLHITDNPIEITLG